MSETKHCWHSDGMVYDTYPSFFYETCCHCGKNRRNGGKFDTTPHGAFVAGPRRIIPDIEDVGPCEPALSRPPATAPEREA